MLHRAIIILQIGALAAIGKIKRNTHCRYILLESIIKRASNDHLGKVEKQ